MPNYVYNVVYRGNRDGSVQETEPQFFSGSARDFARERLLAWMAAHRENESWLVGVNVWDADGEGVWNPNYIACQLSNHELDEGPFDPDQIYVQERQYYVHSLGHEIFGDAAIVPPPGAGRAARPWYELVLPGEGPALAVRCGHQGCWISLKVAPLDAEPPADLEAWEVVEQVVIAPASPVVIYGGLVGSPARHYPDLRGGHDTGYLAVRVSARGRTRPGTVSPLNPRRYPVEDHLIQTWPVPEPGPLAVLKRDEYSSRGEQQDQRRRREGSDMPRPPLTPEQRAAGLNSNARWRQVTAEIREGLSSGSMTLADVIRLAATDDLIGRMSVRGLLAWLPGVGETGAAYILEQLGIASSRRVGSLSPAAREALMGDLPQPPPDLA